MLLTLECGYAFKAYVVNVYSCFIGCMTYHVSLPLFMSTRDIGFPVYATCIMCSILRWASTCLSSSTLMYVVHTRMKPCWCAMAHLAWNFVGFSLWKCGIFLPYSHRENLVRIVLCVPPRIWSEMLLDFYHENKAKCYRIFVMEIW